jgi:nitrous oxidase accessory protein
VILLASLALALPPIQALVDATPTGGVVSLGGVEWLGPAIVDRPMTLEGPGSIVSNGTGDTVIVRVAGVVLDGVTVRGSGLDMNTQDSCVRFGDAARGAVLRASRIFDCLFGVWVDRTDGAAIVGNTIEGRRDLTNMDRGNGVHTHDARHLQISDNEIRHVRDGIYVAATEDSVIDGNRLSDQRYGVHYMYSYRNRISRNHARRDVTGIALMSSRTLEVFGNLCTDNVDHGLLLREIDTSDIHHNVLEHNGYGLFIYLVNKSLIHDNRMAGNDVGVKLWAGSEGNRVWHNELIHNAQQAFYAGSVDEHWGTEDGGNFWSDHLSWDQDGDGRGDRPYQLDATTSNLLHRYPVAALLLASPAVELLRAVQRRLPVFHLPTIHDARPLLRPVGVVASGPYPTPPSAEHCPGAGTCAGSGPPPDLPADAGRGGH